MSESLTVYPQGYKTFSFDTITNDTNAIGKGSDNTTYATLIAYQGDTSVVQWPFDLSVIPDGVEIDSVTCKVHIRFSYGVSSTTAKIQLAAGSVLKGSSVSLPQEPSESEVLMITDAGMWTRDELQSCNLHIEATSASSTSSYAREIRFYGADLTVTYTVKGKKIMLRLNDFPGLPNGYTKLEYVESSGAQYVDTGFQPNQDTRVVIECEPTVTTSSQMAVFGARESNSGQAALAYGFNVMTSTSCRSDYMGTNATISGDYPAGTRISVDMNKNVCTVNGKTGNTTAKTGQTPYNLFLFNVNNIGTPHSTFGFKGKVYSCQIYDNGNKIRDYIPAKNPSGVPGLYDLMNNTFSSSGTSTSLVAGPEYNNVWHSVAHVFKKINGIWVEQTDLANVIKDGVRYKNGMEIENTGPKAIPVTITGAGSALYCYATINDTKYSDAASNIEVMSGDVITFGVYGNSSWAGTVIINNETVFSTYNGAKTYNWTIPDGIYSIRIQLYDDSDDGTTITVTTTSSGDTGGYTVFIGDSGNTDSCYITIDGVKYYGTRQNVSVPTGTVMTAVAKATESYSASIYVNDEPIQRGTNVSHSHTITSDVSVCFSAEDDRSYSGINIKDRVSKNLIIFKLHSDSYSTDYEAEQGMTWAQWCESNYSYENYSILNNRIVWTEDEPWYIYDVKPSDVIADGGEYYEGY